MASGAEPEVWVFQPAVKHYRLALWDRLVQTGAGRYRLVVWGPLDVSPAEQARRSYFHELPLRRWRLMGRELAHWPGAAERIRRQRPSVVILTATAANLSSWTLPGIARRAGAAVVGWSKVNSRSGRRSRMAASVNRRFFQRFDRFLCYGQRSLDELVALGYPADRARVAQNTIDTDLIFHEGAGLLARGAALRSETNLVGKKLLLCVGRMVPQKRQADLIQAWPRLRQLDRDLVLLFVGAGPLLDPTRELARAVDPERIVFTGRVPEGDDYAWLATADLVALPGAIGLALNQALALARPTIIADERGADAEILEHGTTGWRYPRGNQGALVDAVAQVLSHPEEAAAVAQRAREMMHSKVTIEQMVNAFDQTIHEALELSRQRRRLADG